MVLANAESLRDLSVRVVVPKERQWVVNTEVWELVRRCQRVRTLELGCLDVSLCQLEAFWEICGGDTRALKRALTTARVADAHDPKTGRHPTPPPLTKTTGSTPSRSVKLDLCTFDEWPDEVYADDSLTLPAVTTLGLQCISVLRLRDPIKISVFGQARMIRKCVNLGISDGLVAAIRGRTLLGQSD